MEINPHCSGIDLSDDFKDVEVKFTLQKDDKYRHKSWRVLGYELDFQKKDKPAFWSLGFYFLKEEIARIRTTTQIALERNVTRREIFILPWEWMNQYPQYHHVGQTQISKWDHWILYPKYKDLPATTETYKVDGGLVHITRGVPKKLFRNINKIKIN